MSARYSILFLVLIIAIIACNRTKKDMLIRNWHAVKLDNPQLNDMIQQQQLFIDTVGTSTNAEVNRTLYNTTRIDSLKSALQSQLDSFVVLQKMALANTWFNFKKSGIAVLTFNGATDSTSWHFDDDGTLILDELQQTGGVDKLKMLVVQLNDTVLRLRFMQNNINSVVSFHPEKN